MHSIKTDTANNHLMDANSSIGKIYGKRAWQNANGNSYSNAFGDWFKVNVVENPILNPIGAIPATVIDIAQSGNAGNINAWATNPATNRIGYWFEYSKKQKALAAQKNAEAQSNAAYEQALNDQHDAQRLAEAAAAAQQAQNNLANAQNSFPTVADGGKISNILTAKKFHGIPVVVLYAGAGIALSVVLFMLIKK